MTLQGFEALGVVRRAADGIASTATTMATSLDEAVEQLFVGWTPAPPAADHSSYNPSPPTTFLNHHSHNNSQHSSRELSAAANPPPVETAASPPTGEQAANEGWGTWESPFDSGSTSPDTCSQSPNETNVAIAAWRAIPLDGAQERHMGSTHDHGRSVSQSGLVS